MEMAKKVCTILIVIIVVIGMTLPATVLGTSDKRTDLQHTSAERGRIKELLYQYILICGHDYLCKKDVFNFPFKTDIDSRATKCPDCQCDRKCFIRGDCCPDVFFNYPNSQCTSIVVFGNSRFNASISNEMIARCPAGVDNTDVRKCTKDYQNGEMIRNTPVTAANYAITFKNKHCAKCNNVTDFQAWGLSFKCLKFADFNFVSSYIEMIQLAKTKNCTIEYLSDDTNVHGCNTSWTNQNSSMNSVLMIDRCNVSGYWLTYDEAVEHACNSEYNLQYGLYKNIFCFICNPSKHFFQSDLRSTCLSSSDSIVSKACQNYGSTPSTYPFKNIFCKMCNDDENLKSLFKDANATITQSLLKGKTTKFKYVINIHNYYIDHYLSDNEIDSIRTLSKQNSDPRLNVDSGILSSKNSKMNVTKLVLYDYSLNGLYSYCVGNWTPFVFLPLDCSCNPSCLFDEHLNCCLDLVLTTPISCYSDVRIGSNDDKGGYHYVIDGCFLYPEVDETLRTICENPPENDSYGMIPVFDDESKIVYRSLACYLCNRKALTLNVNDKERQYTPWTVELSCNSDLNTDFHVSLKDVLDSAKGTGCAISVKPKGGEISSLRNRNKHFCGNKTPYISQCNMTGAWSDYDSDILYGCERTGLFLPKYLQYKNVFCFLCNPKNSAENQYQTDACTDRQPEELFYGSEIIQACQSLFKIQALSPYKNIFCKYCENNTRFKIPPKTSGSMTEPSIKSSQSNVGQAEIPIVLTPHLHDLFGVDKSKAEDNAPEIITVKQMAVLDKPVTHAWVYDFVAEKYRNLTCFPGKWMIGENCIPLLTVTNNLRYILAFELTGELTEDWSQPNELGSFSSFIKSHLMFIVGTDNIRFDSFYLFSNISSHVQELQNTFTRLLLHTMFVIRSDVNRLETEKSLLNMTKSVIAFQNKTWIVRPELEAFNVPVLIHRMEFLQRYHMIEAVNYSFHSTEYYRPVYVSNLLLCRQIELHSSEYTIDNTSMTLHLKQSNDVFTFDKYLSIDKGNVRVCLEDFQSAMLNEKSKIEKSPIDIALSITNFVCTILSMSGLLVTFFTYCLFKALRSVPGKNNMSLIIAMFFAQGLFQFGSGQTSSKTVCRIIGVLSHYFWLSTFSCMGICSFHMYSVFSRTVISRRFDENECWTVFVYNVIAFGGSCAVVVLSIIVGVTTMKGDFFGYGDDFCFLTCETSLMWSFLLPVIMICCFNIYFFIITTFRIKRSPSVSSNQESRKNYSIYIKLFSVTGVTWLLLIIDSFVHKTTFFSFLVTVLNGCQGLYICLSFVCNKRVAYMYRRMYKTARKESSSFKLTYTSSTKSTSSTLSK